MVLNFSFYYAFLVWSGINCKEFRVSSLNNLATISNKRLTGKDTFDPIPTGVKIIPSLFPLNYHRLPNSAYEQY